jgi:hypothetical protein
VLHKPSREHGSGVKQRRDGVTPDIRFGDKRFRKMVGRKAPTTNKTLNLVDELEYNKVQNGVVGHGAVAETIPSVSSSSLTYHTIWSSISYLASQA